MKLLFDLDGIVADLLGKWLRDAGKLIGRTATKAEITDWNVGACLSGGDKALEDRINEIIVQPGYFDDLELLPGAAEGLRRVAAIPHHSVRIVSSPSEQESSAMEKTRWARTRLPFISRKHVILTHSKEDVRGDALVDDSSRNLAAYGEAWPEARLIAIAYPYNVAAETFGARRFEGYSDTELAWKRIVYTLEELR